MFEGSFPHHPFRSWIRDSGVPKGLLRCYVLKLLDGKPMSGSEIIEEIKGETKGHWTPSPGSIYPLLAWLQDKNFAQIMPKEERGLKRYALTEEAKEFLKAQVKLGETLRKKLEFLAPALIGGFPFGNHSEKYGKMREPTRQFVMALLNLRMMLAQNLSDQIIDEIAEILNQGTKRIEEITERIKKG